MVRAAPLRKGRFLEWSDPSRSSKIGWWAGHTDEKPAMNVKRLPPMQTAIRCVRQGGLSHRGKKRKGEPIFIGAFRTTFSENNSIKQRRGNTPIIAEQETGVQKS